MSKVLYVKKETPNTIAFAKAPLELIREVAGVPCRTVGGASETAVLKHSPLLSDLFVLMPHKFTVPAYLKPGKTLGSRDLGLAQCRAAYAHTLLDEEIDRQGYARNNDDAFRNPKVHGEFGVKRSYASAKSLHKYKLAMDKNLFRIVNGRRRYITTTDGHRPFGLFWIALGEFFDWPLEWGGSAGRSDGNHYSYGWGGRW